MNKLPSKLRRIALLWLYDYAPGPIMTLCAGKPVSEVSDRYCEIMREDIDRWIEELKSLVYGTDKLLTMIVMDAGKEAAFLYQPDNEPETVISIVEMIEPLCAIQKDYRYTSMMEKANDVSLPKWLTGLLARTGASDLTWRITVKETDSEFAKLHTLIDAALLDDYKKKENKLLKLGIGLHRLRTLNFTPAGYNGIKFEFTNSLGIQIYPDSWGWKGPVYLAISGSTRQAEEALRVDIGKLLLPEPPPPVAPPPVVKAHQTPATQLSLF